MAVQLSVLGIIFPASVQDSLWEATVHPRQSFHCRSRLPCDQFGAVGALVVLVKSKYPCWDCICRRCSNRLVTTPPQTIISLPVQTAVCELRAPGAFVVLVAVQVSVLGLYLPPVFKLLRLAIQSAPDNHFAAGPDCRVICSRR